jgi:hypothetical protein
MNTKISINGERMEAKIEAIRLEFQIRLKKVEARAECRRGAGTGAGSYCSPTGLHHALTPVRDRSRAQLLDVPKEIHILHLRLPGPGHRRATRNLERSDLRRKPQGQKRLLREPAPGCHIWQSDKNKGPGCLGNLARICHSHWTACPLRLHRNTQGSHKEGG